MENEVARDLCLSSLYVKELRKALFQEDVEEKEDCCVVILFGEEKNRGGAADGRKDPVSLKIDSTVLQGLAKYVDETHSNGDAIPLNTG